MINTNEPNIVVISIKSPVADSHLSGQLGWQSSVNLTHLPQYPLEESEYYNRIVSLLEDIDIVPLDSLTIAEPAQKAIKQIHQNAIEAFKEQRLKGDVNASFKHTAEKDGKVIYTLDIMAKARDMHPDVSAMLTSF